MAIWNVGSKNGMWKGGRSVASNGYILVRVGTDHHLSDVRGYAYEHRLVAEEKIGRRLKKGEQVHHVDGNKQNNHPSNIEVKSSIAEHRESHRKNGSKLRKINAPNPEILCGCGCGGRFQLYDKVGRPRRYLPSHNMRIRNGRKNKNYLG